MATATHRLTVEEIEVLTHQPEEGIYAYIRSQQYSGDTYPLDKSGYWMVMPPGRTIVRSLEPIAHAQGTFLQAIRYALSLEGFVRYPRNFGRIVPFEVKDLSDI